MKSESEAKLALANVVDGDIITIFSSLMKHCSNNYTKEMLVDCSKPDILTISKLNDGCPPSIDFSLIINDDLKVQAYRGHKKVTVRDLINGFKNQITHYSQVKKMIIRLEKTPLDLRTELRACGEKILRLADEFDDDSGGGEARKTKFIGKQILLLHKRSYSKDDMLDAINIYLRSRNT